MIKVNKIVLKLLSLTAVFLLYFEGMTKFTNFANNLNSGHKVYASETNENEIVVNHDLNRQDIIFPDRDKVKIGITIVNATTDLSVKVGPDTDEDFYPEHKKWNGIPTVAKAGNNLFVAWYTGGEQEPSVNNYICIAASTDMGKTWKNPWMVITGSPLGIVWPIFFRNPYGELCLIYGDNKMTGSQMIKLYNADGSLDKITYSYPHITGARMSVTCKPVLINDGSMLAAYGNNAFDGVPTTIIRSTDGGQTFSPYRIIKSNIEDKYHDFAEVSIVQKKDGRLWALVRLCDGMGIEQSFSSDNGNTWTRASNDLQNPPFYSPGSRFYMARLQSGALLFVTNMQGRNNDRRNMVAWLSEDDGETWPYSLQLDPTQSSYPDFYQDEDGLIYLVHDRDRYGEGGIRLHIFTEDDVKKGEFASTRSEQGIIIAKMDKEYGDIVSVNGAFKKVEAFKTGTELKDIISSMPTEINVTDDNGKDYKITGKYRISGYQKDREGIYDAYFICDDGLPNKLKDGMNNLQFKIVLEKKSGCSSGLTGGKTCIYFVIVAAAIVIKRQLSCN